VGCAHGFRRDEIRIAARYAWYLPDPGRQLLERQLQAQRRGVEIAEAMHLLRGGSPGGALRHLSKELWRRPSSLWSRPWLGAVRRSLAAAWQSAPATSGQRSPNGPWSDSSTTNNS
jgi:hypothetical protein